MNSKFEYVSRGTSVRYVEPRSEFTAAELDNFLAEKRCDDVVINQLYGMGQSHLDVALKSRLIKKISVALDSASLSGFATNECIESAYFNGTLTEPFDFYLAKNIHSLNLKWQKGINGLDRMLWLSELTLGQFSGDQVFLQKLGFLRCLTLVQSKLTSVDFLQAFHDLRKLEVSYAKNLTDTNGLLHVDGSIEELALGHLPKLRQYEVVIAKLKKLKVLKISKCTPLPDLQFVKSLPSLEFLSFVETDVSSGDLTPCIGLKYVGFLVNKKYNCIWSKSENRLILR